MEGWIRLHRQIRNHWVFKNADYFKAWITILTEVNHKAEKVLIEGELIECKRGQSVNSLATWVRVLGDDWTIQKLRTFIKLLEKDKMIVTEGLRKTTRLTVCKYDSYQGEQQADNKQTTDRQQADNKQPTTNNNDKNENNEKNEEEIYTDAQIKIPEWDEVLNHALTLNPNVNRMALRNKYEVWKGDGWRKKYKGQFFEIKNWKNTILNSMKYLGNEPVKQSTKISV